MMIELGLCRFARSVWTISTGRTPDCSLPRVGERSANQTSPRLTATACDARLGYIVCVRSDTMTVSNAPAPPAQLSRAQTLLAVELATFERELPRLLAEGEQDRWVVIRGTDIVTICDTFDEAIQA